MLRTEAAPVAPRTGDAPARQPTADATERRRGRRPAGLGRTPAPRDPFLDNAKYLGILLVAAGHAWEPLREGSRAVTALYTLVYAFHMPVFAIISGRLSRHFEATPGQLARLLTGVVVPYVVFETAYSLFTRWSSEDPDRPITLLDPLYLTWYLAALFIWRLTSPAWRLVRHPLPCALTIAALATLTPSLGDDLDLQRVLQFLPYFVLGLTLDDNPRPPRTLAAPLLIAALALSYWAVPHLDYAWFFHNTAATDLGAPAWTGPLMTLATFACSATLAACFLSCVPRGRTWCTPLGTGTLYAYLLHGFLAQTAEHEGWYESPWLHSPTGVAILTLLTTAITTTLCTPPVRHLCQALLETPLRRALTGGESSGSPRWTATDATNSDPR
ncbi:acyltransferase family protein [Streptomyces sp. KAU_LT]|uniref:acyltransferase family protein n=1 Tax=Streptomyces sp. KAU_LT TaxID=3046669 RepID=UPI0024B6F8FC|nr:acyltransferase family protein [Streptomyces sp. KAU_LT]MDI9832119.1 acyltransferase family protein [Streptomyces sp. KAU_LT]